MIHKNYYRLKKLQNKLLRRKNKVDKTFNNGVFNRYQYPVLTRNHVPLTWIYDLDANNNPYFMERLSVNATFNPGAIYFDNKFYLMVRLEGADRKSIFALAQSNIGIDNFRFIHYPMIWDDIIKEETNAYDMRLVAHEDGYIYGIFCSESKDNQAGKNNTTAAIAQAGLVRSKDLLTWERLPNIKTSSPQQRNVVLHPEFVQGKYAFYTRPQDGFIEASNAGISFGYCEDINQPKIIEDRVVDQRHYHTISEMKNGQGPAPIKTSKGWIHIAHGVRNTAAGLRYVLYVFATDLVEPWRIISKPSGYFMAPWGSERVGDVSNVLFCNGALVVENTVYIYYASSDTRVHVATMTLKQLLDYTFSTPKEQFRSLDSAKQTKSLIEHNEQLLKKARE